MEAPTACGHNAGECSIRVHGTHNAFFPHQVVILGLKIEQGLLGRKCRIRRPTVLFAVRAVIWEMLKITKCRASRHLLQGVENFVGARKIASVAKLGVHHHAGEQLGRGLAFGNALDKGIAEAVIGKVRQIFFNPLTAAGVLGALNVGEQMHQMRTLENDVSNGQFAILKQFGVVDRDMLTCIPLDGKLCKTNHIDTKIIEVAAIDRGNGDRF